MRIVLVLVLGIVWPSTARADAVFEQLVRQSARVGVNEGGFQNRWETALVVQTVRANGRTAERQLAFLLAHSPRVGGTRVCRGGNCLWTPELDWSGARPPSLEVADDLWRVVLRPLWFDTLAFVRALYRGRMVAEPCHLPPRTWGNEKDRPGAIAEGLYPIGCTGPTANDGYTWKARCWRDGAWLCDRRFRPAVTPSVAWSFDVDALVNACGG